jgi:undecaprenyl-diphosphatase
MKKENKKDFLWAVGLLFAFAIWTILISFVDVKEIGPNGSAVGFSAVNGFFHKLTGTNMLLYTITDWMGLIPVFVAFGFAVLGLAEWIKRKNLLKVDFNLFVLGGFYIATICGYILFEMYPINHRPVLINGYLEASYPSSTTLLVLCVMPTAMMQFKNRIKNKTVKNCVLFIIALFSIFMVVGRLISGVHWITDIIGGILLSAGLVMLYYSVCNCKSNKL